VTMETAVDRLRDDDIGKQRRRKVLKVEGGRLPYATLLGGRC
jgi:hypothetical protein